MVDAICEVVRDVIDVNDLGSVVAVSKRKPLRPTTAPSESEIYVSRLPVIGGAHGSSTRHWPREIDDAQAADNAGAVAALAQSRLSRYSRSTPTPVVLSYSVDALAGRASLPRGLHVRDVKRQRP